MTPKNYRGSKLDETLKLELEKMIGDGYTLSPISRPTLQRRLSLKSRSTLILEHRAEMIENAKKVQLRNAGLDINGKKKRNTVHEQLVICKDKLKKSEQEKNLLIEKIAMIINGLHAKGYNVEELMIPLRPNYMQ